MTIRTTKTISAALAATLAATIISGSALAAAHAGKTGYALADGGSTLVVMSDISMPDQAETYALETPVRGLAYRPVTGDLVGFADGMIVTIDPISGEQTDTGATFMDAEIVEGADVAFDFNNAIDAVRAVSSNGDNLVYFPEGFGDNDERANSVRRFTDTFYADGDANADAQPMIFANAYTNAISGSTAESTAQYALDAGTDSLVTLANNEGTLATVGKITVDGSEIDITNKGGFDIVSPDEGTDEAYAILQIEGEENAGLYTIDLSSGAATKLSDLGMGGFSGFAVSMGM